MTGKSARMFNEGMPTAGLLPRDGGPDEARGLHGREEQHRDGHAGEKAVAEGHLRPFGASTSMVGAVGLYRSVDVKPLRGL